jgi:hypothetical protein
MFVVIRGLVQSFSLSSLKVYEKIQKIQWMFAPLSLASTHVQSIVRLWWWRGREECGWLQWWWWFDKKDDFDEFDVVHDIDDYN